MRNTPKLITKIELMTEWNYTENIKNGLDPNFLTLGSHALAEWLCPLFGHNYKARIYHRTGKNPTGCSICNGKVVKKGFNDLESRNPNKAKLWHPFKNTLTPDKVCAHSGKSAWWLGYCGHEWEAIINDNTGCATCTGQKVQAGFNDMATHFPEVADMFILGEKNNSLTPEMFSRYSHKKIWVMCLICDYQWEAMISNLTDKNTRCSKCCNKYTELEKSGEALFNLKKFNQRVLNNANYKPDFQLNDNLYVNTDGLWWHSEGVKKNIRYHFLMRELFEKENKTILQFYEDEIYNKREIVKSIVDNKAGTISNKIMARKCELREIQYDNAKDFFEDNHLMGHCNGSTCIGLYYNNILVSALSYKIKKQYKCIEIARFGSLINAVVVGAFSKLLSEVEQIASKVDIHTITSFCDLRYATGKSYEINGFKRTGVTLGFCWTKKGQRFSRHYCQATPELTEKEHAQQMKLYKIYDAGQAKYEKILNSSSLSK